MLASVVISTYNRSTALPATLDALSHQDVSPQQYEVLVVDDGSTDTTPEVLRQQSPPYRLLTYRLPDNRGVSAGRNVGLRHASGRYIIMISDDLIVPADFITTHVGTLERFPNAWVVGGFEQLEAATDSAFGRFLDDLERSFEEARLAGPLDDDLFEMKMPTARNLSLPRQDLARVGLFDERFRVTCEDQDLAARAAASGIRFIYNAKLRCVHNDQSADLRRYCRFQRLGARDTARLCAKYPDLHGGAPVVRVNGPIHGSDGPALIAKKAVKIVLSTRYGLAAFERAIAVGEGARLPEHVLAKAYRILIGTYIFKGFREGLRELDGQ